MNPGPSEEIGSTARSAIDALKSTPAILFILIFNIVFMAMIAWNAHESGARWERTIAMALKTCEPAKAE